MVDTLQNPPTLQTSNPAPPAGSTTNTIGDTGAQGYEAQTNTVENTTSGLLTDLLKQDSPYMQNAEYMGKQYASSRGLLNSSLGAEAAQRSAIQSALPIAQQDAQLFQTQSLANQQATNAARQFGAQAQNTAGLANLDVASRYGLQNAALDEEARRLQAELQNRVDLQRLGQVNALELQSREQGHQDAMQRLQGQQALDLQTLTENNQVLLQTNTVAAQLYNSFLSNMTDILQDPNIADASRTDMLNTLKTELTNSLELIGGINEIDMSSYFGGGTA